MKTNENIGRIVAAAVTALCASGCPVPAPVPIQPPVEPAATPYEQIFPGLQREAQEKLFEVSAARTERAMRQRVLDFAAWVVSDNERIGLANRDLILAAIRRNEHIRDHSAVETYFFNVEDVYPGSCTPSEHANMDQRVSAMQRVAQACDQGGLVLALEERRTFLRNTRSRLDRHGVCLDSARGRR